MITETDGAGATIATYAYGVGGSLYSMTRGGETYYYHLNGHGDVVALSNAGGSVVASCSYDPWGRSLSSGPSVENPYRYAGYRCDEPSGLYYCWNRHYAPDSRSRRAGACCPGRRERTMSARSAARVGRRTRKGR